MPTRNQLLRQTPESQGISSIAILNFIETIEANIQELHSFMLLRHGTVIAEGWWSPYGPTHPHMLFSLSKSFTSTAVGLAVAEGRLSIDDRVQSFFPERSPVQPSKNQAEMRVRDLLSMVTGHAKDSTDRIIQAADGDWVKAFLLLPVENQPGTHFVYNTGATYVLSAIVQKLTGEKILDYLEPRLFAPLGIKGATWETSPQGINMGGWGLKIKTEDIARFGQLYLQKGQWNGKQIVPSEWVSAASSTQVSNGSKPESDWEQGYGFQFWRCRYAAYRGDGAFGQYCVVMPDQDAVLAITSGLGDMQPPLDIVWKTLLPAMEPAALPESPANVARLAQKLACLALEAPVGVSTSPTADRINGKNFSIEANPLKVKRIKFDFSERGCTLSMRFDGRDQLIKAGFNTWELGFSGFFNPDPFFIRSRQRVAGRAAWTAEDILVARLCFYETPYSLTLTCQFTGDKVTIEQASKVSFIPAELPVLSGTLQNQG